MNYLEELKKFGEVDSHKFDDSYAFPGGGWIVIVTRPNGTCVAETHVTEIEAARGLLYFLTRKDPHMRVF